MQIPMLEINLGLADEQKRTSNRAQSSALDSASATCQNTPAACSHPLVLWNLKFSRSDPPSDNTKTRYC